MTKYIPLSTMGERIKAARKQMGLSQQSIAQELGVSISAVSLWEKDKANITSDKLASLAKVLDCSLEWLIQGKTFNNKSDIEISTTDYQAELLGMCKNAIANSPDETVEDAVHIFQIASSLEGEYLKILLKTAMELDAQQAWSRMTKEERETFTNWMKNK